MDENQFEYVILKKLTHNSEFFSKVVSIIKSKHFKKIGNAEIYKLIKQYFKDYNAQPTLTELITLVKNVPNSEIRAEIINSLQQVSITEEVKNIDFMLDETISWVKDSMYYEALEFGSDGLMKKDDALKLKAQQILDERAKISVDSDLGLDFDDIDKMIEYYSERNIGILTQHKELNKRLGTGFLPGTLSVILAASGVGKSLLMTDFISGQIKKNKNILLVSLEMADKEIMKRVHANALDLPINNLSDLNKTEEQIRQLENEDRTRQSLSKDKIVDAYNRIKTSGTCGRLFVKDYPAGSFSSLQLEALVQSYKNEKNVTFDIIYVDYIGIMKSDLVSPSVGLYSYLKSIGEEIRASAKRLNVPVVSASQLNRGSISNLEADNSNVSDSIGTVMTADFMLFLLQNEQMKENKEMVLKCTKNRFTGRTDSWMMRVDYEHMRFSDMVLESAAQFIQETNMNASKDDDFTSFIPTDPANIVTKEKFEAANNYADLEVKEIYKSDVETLKTDPLNTENLDDIYNSLLKG